MKYLGIKHALCLALLLDGYYCSLGPEYSCNRRPLGTNTAPLPADNRFFLEIDGVDDKYIPGRNYTVRLSSREERSSFIAFTIFLTGDEKYNEKNPRRPIPLDPGRLISSLDTSRTDTITKDVCPNTVFQSDITPKTATQVLWIAPPKENKCVTVNAYVAIKPDVWYNSEGPLTRRVCEDRRKDEDLLPKESKDCRVCEEARYEFEGTWSENTHPKMFPESKDLARFSDVVGATHNKKFTLFKDNSVATEGLRMLAEQGNTTQLEIEILNDLRTNVRTVIKAIGPPKPNMTTIASFRTSKDMHFISLVSAILPSPDWFLGVSNLELCNAHTGTWDPNIRLNLYPIDAGTDSGLKFEAANEETSPFQPIAPAIISKEVDKEQMKPFAKLKINLVRTYITPDCVAQTTEDESTPEEGDEDTDEPSEPENTEPPKLPTDPESRDCPITTWEEWLPCEGDCVDGRVSGYRSRFRYHIVNGVEIGKNFEQNSKNQLHQLQVPESCSDVETSDTEKCEEDCVEDVSESPEEEGGAQRRVWGESIKPGQGWGRK